MDSTTTTTTTTMVVSPSPLMLPPPTLHSSSSNIINNNNNKSTTVIFGNQNLYTFNQKQQQQQQQTMSSTIITTNNNNNTNNNTTTTRHLLPSIKIKTNELFYKWLSQTDKTEQLNEAISYIKSNNKVPKFNELKSCRNVSVYSLFIFCYLHFLFYSPLLLSYFYFYTHSTQGSPKGFYLFLFQYDLHTIIKFVRFNLIYK